MTSITGMTSMTSMTSVTSRTSMTSRKRMTYMRKLTRSRRLSRRRSLTKFFTPGPALSVEWKCHFDHGTKIYDGRKKKSISQIMLIRITLRQRHGPSAFQTQRAVFGSAEDLFQFWPTLNIASFVVMMLLRMVVEMMMKMVVTLTRRTQALQISSPRRSSSPF